MEKIREILKSYTDASVSASSNLYEDLGLDSFFILHFLSDIEDCFHIEIDESEFKDIITVQDVLDLIRQKESISSSNSCSVSRK